MILQTIFGGDPHAYFVSNNYIDKVQLHYVDFIFIQMIIQT